MYDGDFGGDSEDFHDEFSRERHIHHVWYRALAAEHLVKHEALLDACLAHAASHKLTADGRAILRALDLF
jgi:hypothetical protein